MCLTFFCTDYHTFMFCTVRRRRPIHTRRRAATANATIIAGRGCHTTAIGNAHPFSCTDYYTFIFCTVRRRRPIHTRCRRRLRRTRRAATTNATVIAGRGCSTIITGEAHLIFSREIHIRILHSSPSAATTYTSRRHGERDNHRRSDRTHIRNR